MMAESIDLMIPDATKGIIATLITFIIDKSLLTYNQALPKISVINVASKLAPIKEMSFLEKFRQARTVMT